MGIRATRLKHSERFLGSKHPLAAAGVSSEVGQEAREEGTRDYVRIKPQLYIRIRIDARTPSPNSNHTHDWVSSWRILLEYLLAINPPVQEGGLGMAFPQEFTLCVRSWAREGNYNLFAEIERFDTFLLGVVRGKVHIPEDFITSDPGGTLWTKVPGPSPPLIQLKSGSFKK